MSFPRISRCRHITCQSAVSVNVLPLVQSFTAHPVCFRTGFVPSPPLGTSRYDEHRVFVARLLRFCDSASYRFPPLFLCLCVVHILFALFTTGSSDLPLRALSCFCSVLLSSSFLAALSVFCTPCTNAAVEHLRTSCYKCSSGD